MFGVTDLFNAKFKIENIPSVIPNQTRQGYCKLWAPNTGGLYNDIVIDRNLLLNASDEKIAMVMIHECLHAYLNVKLRHPSIGMPVNNINNMDLAAAINMCYNGFNGNQTQHDFFADHLVPVITEILMDLKNTLLTPQQRNSVENPTNGSAFIYVPTNAIPRTASSTQIPWNWNDYFRHLSFEGLQNCNVFPNYYPQNSVEDYYRKNYIDAGRIVILP